MLLGLGLERMGDVIDDSLDFLGRKIKCGHGGMPFLHRFCDKLINILLLPELGLGEIGGAGRESSTCRPLAVSLEPMTNHALLPVQVLPLFELICSRSLWKKHSPTEQDEQ